MEETYAIKWREPDGQTYLGQLALGIDALRLEGRRADRPAVIRQIAYGDLLHLRSERRVADRLDGQPALVLERVGGTFLVTSAGLGAGILQEIFERVVDLASGPKNAAENPQ